MPKTNLTLRLEADIIRRAKAIAARQGTSVSAMVARELETLVAREAFEEARWRALDVMASAKPRGGRTWARDDLYFERPTASRS